jgi:mannosyltransferase
MIFIIILALIVRLINLNQSFWLDEAAQVIESARPFMDQFQLAADFHPPLYHVILHFWMKFGISEIWVRILSVILGLLSIYFIYKISSVFKQEKIGKIAAFLLAISPYHIWYSQEVRPYMLFVTVSLFSSWLFFKKEWFWYGLSVILGLYSHYFFPVLLLSHGLLVFRFYKKSCMNWIKSIVFGGIFFIPWIPSFIQQVKIGTNGFFSGWTDIVSVSVTKAVPLTFIKFVFGKTSISQNYIYISLTVFTLILFCYSAVNCWKDKKGKQIFILFAISMLTILGISLFIPVIAPQRMIFLLPFYYFILAYGTENVSKLGRILFLSACIVPSIIGMFDYYTNVNIQRENWRDATRYIESAANDRTAALFVFPDPFAPYMWYNTHRIAAFGIAPHFVIQNNDLLNLADKIQDKNRIYLFQYLTGLTDPTEKTKNYLPTIGFVQKQTVDFPGVGFIYVFDRS